jgi:hypothetical protein
MEQKPKLLEQVRAIAGARHLSRKPEFNRDEIGSK